MIYKIPQIIKNSLLNKKPNRVVYTAITGKYDVLLDPEYINNNWDYICFTDNENMVSDFWEIRMMEDSNLDNVKKARKYKILPHQYLEEYDYSLWIDGNFRIVGDIDYYIKRYADISSAVCFKHPERDCTYDEAEVIIELGKDSENIVLKQIDKYVIDKYPKNHGLIASGILYRKHNDPELKELMNDWWYEVESHSRRDQLSFNYVCWKKGFEYDLCDLCYWNNEFFERLNHRKIE